MTATRDLAMIDDLIQRLELLLEEFKLRLTDRGEDTGNESTD